jgi:hypothetical protein
MGVSKPIKPTKSNYQKKTNNPRRGRPPKPEYVDSWSKYSIKRPKFTSEQFHEQDNHCARCDGTSFFSELQNLPKQPHYRTYGYQTRRVLWRIRCANGKCSEPFGVILKLEHWDSVDS